MNRRKVAYWNSLRKKLNFFVMIITVFVLLLLFFVHKGLMTNNLFDLFELFVIVNLPLLIFELIDRSYDFKEKKKLKVVFMYFAYLMIVLEFVSLIFKLV